MFKSRLVWLLSGIAVAVGMVALAQVPISGLPNAGTQTGSEYVPEVQNGSTVKTTTAVLAAFAATAANPTGTVSLTAVNGSSTYFMRADAAPPLSQSISPTWTGHHIWTVSTDPAITINGPTQGPVLEWGNGTNTGDIYINTVAVQVGSHTNFPFCIYVDFGNCALEVQTGATDGTVQIVDSAGNLQNAGYLGCPYNIESSSYTVALVDRGKCIRVNASSVTISLPCSGTFALGDVVSIVVGASETATLTASSGTLYWGNGTTTSGNRTVTGIATATVLFDGNTGSTSSDCTVSGAGIS